MMWSRKRGGIRCSEEDQRRLTHARNYRQAAEKEHEDTMEGWHEVNEVMVPLRRRAERNHFADLFPWLGGGGSAE